MIYDGVFGSLLLNLGPRYKCLLFFGCPLYPYLYERSQLMMLSLVPYLLLPGGALLARV